MTTDSPIWRSQRTEVTTETGRQQIASALDRRVATFPASVSYTVGSAGDFGTISAALDFLSKFTPGASSFIIAEITILSGTIISEQVLVAYKDLSWCRISSEDTEVQVVSSALTSQLSTSFGTANEYFLGAESGRLPRIDCLFRMDNSAPSITKHGIMLVRGSQCRVVDNCGVLDAQGNGAFVDDGSTLVANRATFDGALGDYGIWCRAGSTVSAEGVSCIDAGTYAGIGLTRGSIGNMQSADCSIVSASPRIGFFASQASCANAESSVAHGCTNAYRTRGASIMNATFAAADNCTEGVVYAERSSSVNVAAGVFNNPASNLISSFSSSRVEAAYMASTGGPAGPSSLVVERGGEISAEFCDISTAGRVISSYTGGAVTVNNATLVSGDLNIVARSGSTVTCSEASLTRTGGGTVITLGGGSGGGAFVIANGSTDPSTGSPPVLGVAQNTLTSQGYIIANW